MDVETGSLIGGNGSDDKAREPGTAADLRALQGNTERDRILPALGVCAVAPAVLGPLQALAQGRETRC